MYLHRVTQRVSALYDSGTDGHYISEDDRKKANMPVLNKSTIRVGVVNGKTSKAVHTTQLPFKGMSDKATQADTFNDFKNLLLSVGKFADDRNTSMFTKDGVRVTKRRTCSSHVRVNQYSSGAETKTNDTSSNRR